MRAVGGDWRPSMESCRRAQRAPRAHGRRACAPVRACARRTAAEDVRRPMPAMVRARGPLPEGPTHGHKLREHVRVSLPFERRRKAPRAARRAAATWAVSHSGLLSSTRTRRGTRAVQEAPTLPQRNGPVGAEDWGGCGAPLVRELMRQGPRMPEESRSCGSIVPLRERRRRVQGRLSEPVEHARQDPAASLADLRRATWMSSGT